MFYSLSNKFSLKKGIRSKITKMIPCAPAIQYVEVNIEGAKVPAGTRDADGGRR